MKKPCFFMRNSGKAPGRGNHGILKTSIGAALLSAICFLGCAAAAEYEETGRMVKGGLVFDSAESREWSGVPMNGGILLEDFPVLCQFPELPTGCEITSLSMVLNYYGFSADKCDLSDNYLVKGPIGTTNFWDTFVGDPRKSDAYGCYAPAIVDAANAYLDQYNDGLQAFDVSGSTLHGLYDYIDMGLPVIIWGTVDCQEGAYSTKWVIDGETITWYAPEHCLVLVGYDEDNVWVADPAAGILRSYPCDDFERGFDALHKQAVIIQ